ncbi:MAG: hypothetical protein KJZ80_08670 [Hyphomicrobiaceae bacterium]|nr:hypothetical protein [Hyphomicrobiaceae bacterium]
MTSAIAHIARSLTVLAFGLAFAFGPAAAQDAEFKQIKLTEKHVQGFIAAQKDLNDIADKLQSTSDQPDPKLQAELESIAKKNGFASFEELDDVAANISMVMAGVDPQSGEYTDPVESIKKEIEEIKADKSIPDKEKKQMLQEMQEALDTTPALEHPENVQVVKKYRAEIDKALQ